MNIGIMVDNDADAGNVLCAMYVYRYSFFDCKSSMRDVGNPDRKKSILKVKKPTYVAPSN